MTPKEIATMLDAMDQIIEVVKGYQSKLEEAGYSPTAAESMAMDFHRMLIARAEGGKK